MIPLAPARLRRLAREFRAADHALTAFHQEGDEPMYGPPPERHLACRLDSSMSGEEISALGVAALAQPIRPPRTVTEFAWVKALLAFIQESQRDACDATTRMLIKAADRAGVDLFGSGIVGLQRYLAAFLLGDELQIPDHQGASVSEVIG